MSTQDFRLDLGIPTFAGFLQIGPVPKHIMTAQNRISP